MLNVFKYIAPGGIGRLIEPRPIDTGCAAEMDLVDYTSESAPAPCGAATGLRLEWQGAGGGCSRPLGHSGVHVCGDRRRGTVYARWIVV